MFSALLLIASACAAACSPDPVVDDRPEPRIDPFMQDRAAAPGAGPEMQPADGQTAIASVDVRCGGLCGGVTLVRLDRVGEEWKMTAEATMWVS